MAIQASSIKGAITSSSRKECWVESMILGFGIPAAIWVVSGVISASIPAAVHGSPEQRFFFWFSAGVIVEWLFVIGLWFVVRRRGLSFADFGVWRLGHRSLAISGCCPECTFQSQMRSCPMHSTFLPR
jgi:hypothetical protein